MTIVEVGMHITAILDIPQYWRVTRDDLIREHKHPTFLSHGGQAK